VLLAVLSVFALLLWRGSWRIDVRRRRLWSLYVVAPLARPG
jgi:hypothetical protein